MLVYNCHGAHLDLHSFPTRRSSDLIALAVEGGQRLGVQRLFIAIVRAEVESLDRSEEHTSELQSRRDVVCRLLLEKKKHQMRIHQFALLSLVLLLTRFWHVFVLFA